MKVAIMQPYFLPYIGYFQLISAVDLFIVYDNIKYTKKGWINRNRLLLNEQDAMFSIPLKRGSDSLDICVRELASDFSPSKLLNQFRGAYKRAPFFNETIILLEEIINFDDTNLFRYILHSIRKICDHLDISTEIKISSDVEVNHGLKSVDRVIDLCLASHGSMYINPIGGLELYFPETFIAQDLKLRFLRSRPLEYSQYEDKFVPWLSIIDVLMFNSIPRVKDALAQFDLVEG